MILPSMEIDSISIGRDGGISYLNKLCHVNTAAFLDVRHVIVIDIR